MHFNSIEVKNIIFILFLGLISISASSQKFNYGLYLGCSLSEWTHEIDEFIYGIEDGMNSEIGFSDFDFENNRRIGGVFGGFLEMGLNDKLYIRPHLIYIQKGTKLKGSGIVSGTYMDMNMTIQTDYVELPFLVKYTPVKPESFVRPYIFAGPSVCYGVVSKIKVVGKANGERESDSEDFEGLEDFNYGVNFGGGLKFNEIAVEFRYQNTFSKVLQEYSSEGLDIRSDLISVSLMIHMY